MRKRLVLVVPLLALFAFVATAEATDIAPVEGEAMDVQPTGTSVVNDPVYSGGKALKFNRDVTATEKVTFTSSHDVVVMARASQMGGSPKLAVSVNGTFTPAQDIINRGAPEPYTFDVNASGPVTIGVQASNTGFRRNAFVDVLSFPAGGGGSTPPTDTDGDGVPDSTDNCDTQDGPASNNGCPVTTPPPTSWNCTGSGTNQITPDEDIDAIINNDPSGTATRFCVHAGTYQVSSVARLKAGDTLDAEPGTTAAVGPAIKPTPVVKLVGNGTENLLSAIGNRITISWVDLSGARGTGNGVGSAIAAGSAGSDFLVEFSRIHNNDSVGISNMHGSVFDSEFFSNSEASASIGFNASAVKGITEYEAGRVYVHDEQGNGLWCDHGCAEDSARENGFWVHDSVVINNDRAGIRVEDSPSEHLLQRNEVHGNGLVERRGGIDIRDSQNVTVENNFFGDRGARGESYPPNGDRIGVRATDSGRSDRVDLANVIVQNNTMNGDRIVTCGGPVVCRNNNP